MAGYSGTPLAKKLGIKDNMRLMVLNAPPGYRSWLEGLPETARVESRLSTPAAAVHLFTTRRAELRDRLTQLRTALEPAGFVWVSWPKKTANVPTDVTEDVIRDVALPMGFVDVKVCAVTDTWSGLKLVIRKAARPKGSRSSSAPPAGRR